MTKTRDWGKSDKRRIVAKRAAAAEVPSTNISAKVAGLRAEAAFYRGGPKRPPTIRGMQAACRRKNKITLPTVSMLKGDGE
jgi:hypothetical protein